MWRMEQQQITEPPEPTARPKTMSGGRLGRPSELIEERLDKGAYVVKGMRSEFLDRLGYSAVESGFDDHDT